MNIKVFRVTTKAVPHSLRDKSQVREPLRLAQCFKIILWSYQIVANGELVLELKQKHKKMKKLKKKNNKKIIDMHIHEWVDIQYRTIY